MPIFRLARVRRLVRVASGTTNARAISAVVSPTTARKVSYLGLAVDGRVAAGEDETELVVGFAFG